MQIIFNLNANTVLKNHQNIIHNFSRIFSWELWFFSCKKHPDYRGNRKTTFWEKPHSLQQVIQGNSISILWKKVGIKGSSIKYVRKISRKTNISDPLIRTRTCALMDGTKHRQNSFQNTYWRKTVVWLFENNNKVKGE